MYRSNIIYSENGEINYPYIWPSLMVWQQDGEKINKPQSMLRFLNTHM